MVHDLELTGFRHHVIRVVSPLVTLIHKRCLCGAAIAARQRPHYGICERCRLTAGLEDDDLDKLRFMLGATGHHPKTRWRFRNHYLCNVQDLDATQRLEMAGLVTAGAQLLQLHYFHATADSCRAAGLDRAGIARALKGRP